MSEHWGEVPENTLESLRHGISHTDGIEFDIRLTSDNELIIHHDPIVSIPRERLEGRSKWVDSWTLDELKDEGFCSLNDLLDDSIVYEQWIEKGKMVCLEFKRPHLLAPNGRGLFTKSRQYETMANAMKLAETKLDLHEIPSQNSVFYAFFRGMKKTITNYGIKRNWAELMPSTPSFGSRTIKRLYAYPQYMITPFSRLVKKHRNAGASMIPCAIEYFSPIYGRALLGKKVGLAGKRAEFLSQCQRGMPVYVWPAKPELEHQILSAGLTGLTDHTDPALTWLPSGNARWLQPATSPLDEEQQKVLDNATRENHLSVIEQLKFEVPSWNDCGKQRKLDLIEMWRKKWNWKQSDDQILSKCGSSPPWQSVRLIGHRGSGKTSRPVIK